MEKGSVQRKTYVGNTFEKDIKKLEPRKAYKYLRVEESHDVEHKNEKEKLKKKRMLEETEISFGHQIKRKG